MAARSAIVIDVLIWEPRPKESANRPLKASLDVLDTGGFAVMLCPMVAGVIGREFGAEDPAEESNANTSGCGFRLSGPALTPICSPADPTVVDELDFVEGADISHRSANLSAMMCLDYGGQSF